METVIKKLLLNISVTLSLSVLITVLGLTHQSYAASYSVTNTNDSGAGSLRQAIISANSNSGLDTITFSAGSGPIRISPTSRLPTIVSPVVLNATSQPGFSDTPIVELSGVNAGTNAQGFYIGGAGSGSTIRGFIINSFSAQGIFMDTSNNSIKGNYIGTSADGTSAAANGGGGIGIYSGTTLANTNNNTIGGSSVSDRNIVSGNGGNGIVINAQTGGHTQNNVISGNFVGTNAAGTQAIPNDADGILINDAGGGTANNNTIGGTDSVTPDGPCTGACNLVSGNGYNGIGVWHTGAPSNTILGNFVGVNVAGSWVIRNANIGVELNESPNNIVGGTDAASRNILSGNAGAGVFITGAASQGNRVTGNYIGVNSNGSYSLNNLYGGVGIGYSPGIQPARNNIIGSSTNKTVGICDGGCNIISGNAGNGILLSSSSGNTITANHIGVNRQNSAYVVNTSDGIGLIDSPNNMIGGTDPSNGNIINGNTDNGVVLIGNSTGSRIVNNTLAGNGGNGILVAGGISIAILQNAIYGSGKIGIDLGQNGITRNDNGDNDNGVNNQQNFPEIYSAKNTNGSSYVSGTLNSSPNETYRLEFFQSDGCNAGKPNNYGEGQKYLGGLTLTVDIFGNSAYTFTSPTPLTGNKYITATATRMIGSTPAETSEFGLCRLVNTSRPGFTNGANWSLKDDLSSGTSDKDFGYGFPSTLLMCAWDSNQKGVKLPVVVSPNNSWYFRASYTTGVADLNFQYGAQGAKPVCGDWDGDSIDTIGTFKGGVWALRNANSGGAPERVFAFGGNDSAFQPISGDWNGDGIDSVGVVKNGGSFFWRLTDNVTTDSAGYDFFYGGGGKPVVGDWNGDGTDGIGIIYNDRDWQLRNVANSGPAQISFNFGAPNITPLSW